LLRLAQPHGQGFFIAFFCGKLEELEYLKRARHCKQQPGQQAENLKKPEAAPHMRRGMEFYL